MAISLDNTYMTNYALDASDAAASKLTSKLESAATDEETLSACRQFESYMIEQMFKNMREATKVLTDEDEDSDGSDYLDMFSDNYYQDIAERMVNSGQGLGIAEQLYHSIKLQQGQS